MRRALFSLVSWFDTSMATASETPSDRVDWLRVVPFIGLHLSCLAVIWVGWSPFAVGVAVALYLIRMFAITGFYHRYFSHRSFKTSRVLQFLFAVIGASAIQRGPLWWAAHHREHHADSDGPGDPHSPGRDGFLHSHMLWFMTEAGFRAPSHRVADWNRYPELRLLDRFDILVPILLAVGLLLWGQYLEVARPDLGVTGWQLLVWAFSISTVALFHGTVTINSIAHRWGSRSYDTDDDSRNNAVLALITLGEGWHNNHHRYPVATRQGHRWWQLDITFYLLWSMSKLGLIWDLKPVPAEVVASASDRRVR
jgi:stearoyl-CoA desaturase (delta-9 desaturase)